MGGRHWCRPGADRGGRRGLVRWSGPPAVPVGDPDPAHRRRGVARLRHILDRHARAMSDAPLNQAGSRDTGTSPIAGRVDELLEIARATRGFMPDDEGLALFHAALRAGEAFAPPT